VPRNDEVTVCRKHRLDPQIELVAPGIVVLLVAAAIKQLERLKKLLQTNP
jgi:uracil-DNA glycosylase